MKPTKFFASSAIQGFTSYPEVTDLRTFSYLQEKSKFGFEEYLSITALVYWFVTRLWRTTGSVPASAILLIFASKIRLTEGNKQTYLMELGAHLE